jgi:hypothetical protein
MSFTSRSFLHSRNAAYGENWVQQFRFSMLRFFLDDSWPEEEGVRGKVAEIKGVALGARVATERRLLGGASLVLLMMAGVARTARATAVVTALAVAVSRRHDQEAKQYSYKHGALHL